MPARLERLGGNIDVLWMLPDATILNPEFIEYLMLFSFQNNLPVFSFAKKTVSLGVVAALNVSPHDGGAQAGEITRRLIQGEKGPVRACAQHPRMIVNKKVAVKIGVKINDAITGYAETVE
jgi:putative ABC transport system substrate-binding protein